MVLNFIKPDKTADFEMVMGKLKEAMAKSEKPERKQQAAGWKVFKSPDPGRRQHAVRLRRRSGVERRRLSGVEHHRGSVPAGRGERHPEEVRRMPTRRA